MVAQFHVSLTPALDEVGFSVASTGRHKKKTVTFEKPPQKLKKSKIKKLLTEIEPLQLVF